MSPTIMLSVAKQLLKWEQLFEHVDWGVVLFGPRGLTMRAVNPAFAAMHGYTVEELTGRPRADVLTPESLEEAQRCLKMADERGHYIFEDVHVRKDGSTFPALVDHTTVRSDNGKIVLRWGNCQDATAKKQLEERLREKQKVESLGVLAGGVAHDFNNLLTTIMGNVDLALKMLPADIPAHANLTEALRASEKAAEVTRQMLAYSGKGGFVTEPVNLSDEVRAATQLIHSSIPKNVRLELDLSVDIPPCDADRCMIQQLIVNLVVNGAEAIGKQEGTVRVKTEAETITGVIQGDFSVGETQLGRYVCLEVRDTGCGMDQSTLPHIFDPFFSTKFTGRGLGLAACLGIVSSYHGEIVVRSKSGKGTTFRVLLPVAEAKIGRKQARCHSVARNAGNGKHEAHVRRRKPRMP